MSEESAVRPAVLIVSPPDEPHTAVVMRMLRDRHVPCACVDATDVGDRRVIVDIPRARLLLAAPDVDVDLMQLACEVGLEIPATLVTNDPDRAHEFFATCANGMIYKTLEPEARV